MANAETLEKYLVGEDNSYLLNDNNNGKVIMLSGKWGSGKTHFWKNKIATKELKEELKKEEKAYGYISLYGKSSIIEIENDIFSQFYDEAIGGENIVTKTASTFTKLVKRYGGFSSILDFSKLAEAGEEKQKDNIQRVALSRLNNGGIICFDDFERKSKDIDLNDLFGFITQLTINFDCKVVIILNDDVFEGKEKEIFSNVKEKTVSKFLKYEPDIAQLFEMVFNSDKRYNIVLDNYRDIILKTIEETEELNARIYIQVLDNLVEWIEKSHENDKDILRCLILVNINFILNHNIIRIHEKIQSDKDNYNYLYYSLGLKYDKLFDFYHNPKEESNNEPYEEYELKLINTINSNEYLLNYFKTNRNIFKSHYFANRFLISESVDNETFQKINNFIETGIL